MNVRIDNIRYGAVIDFRSFICFITIITEAISIKQEPINIIIFME